MNVVYSDQYLEVQTPSIFLAGPTPRCHDVPSWRPGALAILEELQYTGQVLVPERKDWVNFDYLDQVEWEYKGLSECSVIAFWIPRDMKTMPALTTNCEFGLWVTGGRSIYGRPDNAPNNRYLDWLYRKATGNKREPFNDLKQLLSAAIEATKGGLT